MTSYEEFKLLMQSSDKGYHHGYHRYYYPILKEFEFYPIRLLEIGVDDGKSMDIWKSFFNKPDHIYGIGYKNYQTKEIEKVNDHMTLYMGDQSSKVFLNRMIETSGGQFDVIIDDGSHVPSHVITSFETLWGALKPGGYYIIEDIETSYWGKHASIYGYSFKNEISVIEYFKKRLDEVNNEFRKNTHTSTIGSVSFMNNMIIIKKMSNVDTQYCKRKYRFEHFLPNLYM